MGHCTQDRDLLLAQRCASGSQEAWGVFWTRFHPMVRTVVINKKRASYQDTEDMVQDVFFELIEALKKYDGTYSLHQFVFGVANRTARGEFRRSMASKRTGDTDPIEHHDRGQEGFIQIRDPGDSPLIKMIKAQSEEILRQGLWALDPECFRLVTLRYYEGCPVGEIAEMLGAKENTVTKKTGRCLEKLKANCHEITRKGCKK